VILYHSNVSRKIKAVGIVFAVIVVILLVTRVIEGVSSEGVV
jgi:hypothetical protein